MQIGNVLALPEASQMVAQIKVQKQKIDDQHFERSLSKAAKGVDNNNNKKEAETGATMKYILRKKRILN